MYECQYCHEQLTVLPHGVVVACSCEGARNAEVENRERRVVWAAERDRALAAERTRRQRGRG